MKKTMKLKRLLESTPGYENRKFGQSLPTLASVQKSYQGVNLTADMLKDMDGITQHEDGDYILDTVKEAAPRMKVARHQKELDQAMQSRIRAQNIMALDQPGQYKRVDKAFKQIKKQFMKFKGLVNIAG